jgi:thioredoxin reductase (NADPH)
LDIWDATVVGGGPAGLTCGRELARAGARVRVVETATLGGQLVNYTTLRESPLGDPPIPAWDVAEKMLDGLVAAGGTLELDKVQHVVLGTQGVEVESERLGKWWSRAVVLATGSTEARIEADGASELEGRGLSYCADCDAPLFKDRRVAVVGCGRLVAWEALTLAELSAEVFALDCSRDAGTRSRNAAILDSVANVTVMACSRVTALEGQGRLESIRYLTDEGSAEETLAVDGLFGASRGGAASPDISGINILDAASRFSVGPDLAIGGAQGLFAIGDARSHAPMLLSSAVGDAFQATEAVLAYLDGAG